MKPIFVGTLTYYNREIYASKTLSSYFFSPKLFDVFGLGLGPSPLLEDESSTIHRPVVKKSSSRRTKMTTDIAAWTGCLGQ